jgi:hypothetical protein
MKESFGTMCMGRRSWLGKGSLSWSRSGSETQAVFPQAVVLLRIAEASGQSAGQMMALIEGAQRQQTGITGDLALGKIGADGLMTIEGEAQLW